MESARVPVCERLDSVVQESSNASAVQSSDLKGNGIQEKALPGQPICPPETSATASENASLRSKVQIYIYKR